MKIHFNSIKRNGDKYIYEYHTDKNGNFKSTFRYLSIAGIIGSFKVVSEKSWLYLIPFWIVIIVLSKTLDWIIQKWIVQKNSDFETPEMAKERHMRAALKTLSRVDNLTNKLVETFPTYDPSKSYDWSENEVYCSELEKVQSEHVKDFEILTWPTTRSCSDESNKIFFEDIGLYIKKADRNRFIKDKFNFNGPVYIREYLAFDQNGNPLLWGYFKHSKTRVLLQQAKDHLSKGGKAQPDTPYFVI